MFDSVYTGKNVLVTGHTGFKGSWLALWLETLGAHVTGYSLDVPTQPSHFELLNLSCQTITGDVLHFEKLSNTIKETRPDIIFHLAAQPLVRRSYNEPLLTFQTNVMGTAHVLEAVRQHPEVKAVVNVTTDKVYENKERSEPYKEEESLGGYDPYSASKAGSEIVSGSFSQAFFNPKDYGKKHHTLVASARSGNVIGGGDWADDRLIPDIVRAANFKKNVSIRNPDSTRPWQHVLEPLSGYLLLGAELLKGNTSVASSWNFGPNTNHEISVKEVLLECQKIWPEIAFELIPDTHFHEASRLQLDSNKAKNQLLWGNVFSYKENIEHTINWYRNFYEKKTVDSSKQLDKYITLAKKRGLAWAQ